MAGLSLRRSRDGKQKQNALLQAFAANVHEHEQTPIIFRHSKPYDVLRSELMRIALESPRNDLSQLRVPGAKIQFDSISEAVCAILLEKYVHGWECVPFKTYQVPLMLGRRADFVVGNVVIEYHPIELKHEFHNDLAFKRYKAAMWMVAPRMRNEIEAAICDEMRAQYFDRRRTILNSMQEFRNHDLQVLCDAREFCGLVASLSRNAKPAEVLADWRSTFNAVAA